MNGQQAQSVNDDLLSGKLNAWLNSLYLSEDAKDAIWNQFYKVDATQDDVAATASQFLGKNRDKDQRLNELLNLRQPLLGLDVQQQPSEPVSAAMPEPATPTVKGKVGDIASSFMERAVPVAGAMAEGAMTPVKGLYQVGQRAVMEDVLGFQPTETDYVLPEGMTWEQYAKQELPLRLLAAPSAAVASGIKQMLIEPQLINLEKAAAIEPKTVSDVAQKIGYGAAGLIPVVGPAAAALAEQGVKAYEENTPEAYAKMLAELGASYAIGKVTPKVLGSMGKLSPRSLRENYQAVRGMENVNPAERMQHGLKVKPGDIKTHKAKMTQAAEDLASGFEKLGENMSDDVLDPVTNTMRPAQNFEKLERAINAANLQKEEYAQMLSQYRTGSQRLPVIPKADIAKAFKDNLPKDILQGTRSPSQAMKSEMRAYAEHENAIRAMPKDLDVLDIDKKLTELNSRLAGYLSDKTSPAEKLAIERAGGTNFQIDLAMYRALQQAYDDSFNNIQLPEVRAIAKRWGNMKDTVKRLTDEYGSEITKGQYGLGGMATTMTSTRSGIGALISAAQQRYMPALKQATEATVVPEIVALEKDLASRTSAIEQAVNKVRADRAKAKRAQTPIGQIETMLEQQPTMRRTLRSAPVMTAGAMQTLMFDGQPIRLTGRESGGYEEFMFMGGPNKGKLGYRKIER